MKKFFSMLLLLCGFFTLSATLVGVNAAEIVSYKLVTDVSELTIGSTIIITDTDVKYALSTTQNNNNRGSVAITISSDGSIPATDGIQDINLGEGTQTGTFAFNVGSGYLYAASSSANNLKTATAKSENSDWKISIDSTSYEAEIKAQGTYTRNLLRKNTSGAMFSCYGQGQTAVKVYKKYVETAGADEVANVKFYWNNGTDAIVKEETVTKGTEIIFPSNPKRPGYVFLGWYDAAEGGNKVESLSPNQDTALYAQWETDIYHHLVIDSTVVNKLPNASSSSGYGPYNGSHRDAAGEEFFTNQVMPESGILSFQGGAGFVYNSIAISGTIASITLEIEAGSYTVSTSTSVLNDDGENVVTLSSENNKLIVNNSSDSYFFIKLVGTKQGKVKSIDIAYTYVEKTTYTVTFNAGDGVSFKEGKGVSIVANKGETVTVTLPTQDDLVSTPYKYSILSIWNGKINRHPGETVELSEDMAYTAVYVAPENLTIAQAIEVADLAGTTATSIQFSTTATITAIDGKNVSISDDSTSDPFIAYNPNILANLHVGDVVTFTGKIKTYNSTKEYDSPKAVIVKSTINAFEAVQTMSSLKLDEYVSIRFGNMISLDAYDANATYGVVVSKNQEEVKNLTAESIETFKTAGQACVCVPVRVNAEGVEDANGEFYQFALVLTDVPASEYGEVLHATMYMIINGNVYTAQVKEASVKSVATAYLDGDTSRFSANTLEILNQLAA